MLLCKTEEDSGDRMRRERVNADGGERARERRPCGLLLVVVGAAVLVRLDRITQEAVRLHAVLRRPVVILQLHDETADAPPRIASVADGVELAELSCTQPLDYGLKVKLGFQFALERDMELVAILDGGMRYPMRLLAALVGPIEQGQADMVLAIPGRKRAGAARGEGGGEQFAPRFVSRLVSVLARARLRGWHCGFRVYRVSAFRDLPFAVNADSRMFNTEIIIQFLLRNCRIVEVPAPDYRHQRLGFFEKLRFAAGMFEASILSSLHRLCIFYQRKYDIQNPADIYGLKLGYRSSHTMALDHVPAGARVLDIGCGNSAFAGLLRAKHCYVSGIDQHDPGVCKNIDQYMQLDLDVRSHEFATEGYSHILLLDVVEHLRFPEVLLDHIRNTSGRCKPRVIVTVPNVAFFIIRLRLLFGSFHYGKLGILDITHTHLFTEASIRALLEQSGYTVQTVAGIPAPYPKAVGLNALGRTLLLCNNALIGLSRSLFSYQIFLEATPKPTLSDLQGVSASCPAPTAQS